MVAFASTEKPPFNISAFQCLLCLLLKPTSLQILPFESWGMFAQHMPEIFYHQIHSEHVWNSTSEHNKYISLFLDRVLQCFIVVAVEELFFLVILHVIVDDQVWPSSLVKESRCSLVWLSR